MSLWTPGGEVPVNRDQPQDPGPDPDAGAGEPGAPSAGRGGAPRLSEAALADAAAALGVELDQLTAEQRVELEAMVTEMAETQARLANTPAAQVIANHVVGFHELAAIHLNQDPPHFDEASLAIDAMAAVLTAIGDRMGDIEPQLRAGLNQLQAAFVELRTRYGNAPE